MKHNLTQLKEGAVKGCRKERRNKYAEDLESDRIHQPTRADPRSKTLRVEICNNFPLLVDMSSARAPFPW